MPSNNCCLVNTVAPRVQNVWVGVFVYKCVGSTLALLAWIFHDQGFASKVDDFTSEKVSGEQLTTRVIVTWQEGIPLRGRCLILLPTMQLIQVCPSLFGHSQALPDTDPPGMCAPESGASCVLRFGLLLVTLHQLHASVLSICRGKRYDIAPRGPQSDVSRKPLQQHVLLHAQAPLCAFSSVRLQSTVSDPLLWCPGKRLSFHLRAAQLPPPPPRSPSGVLYWTVHAKIRGGCRHRAHPESTTRGPQLFVLGGPF